MNNKFLSLFICSYLLILTIKNINCFTLIILLSIFIYLIINKQYKLVVINILISLFIFISFNIKGERYADFNNTFKVVEVHDNYCLIKQENTKYLLYPDNISLNEGNKILIKGKVNDITPNGIPYLFSFKEYLNNRRVYYQIDFQSIEIVDESITIQNQIINFLLAKINYSRSYLKLLLFNNKSLEIENFYDNLIQISAIQLFVISGFHIMFLYNILAKIINKILKKRGENIILFILFFYLYLLKFTISSLRAFLSITLNKINKVLKLNYSSLDINSLIGLIFLIINPKIAFLVSFQLSFIVTISICLIQYLRNDQRNILMIAIPFLTSLPIIINMNGLIGVINILMNTLLTPFVSIIYLLGIMCIFAPFTDKYLYYIFLGFEEIVDRINRINIYVKFPYLSIGWVIIYYLIIYCLLLFHYLKNKRAIKNNIVILTLFTGLWYYKPFSNPYIIFLDVGQGDCCLIHGKNNEYNILIDTGGNYYSDIATNKLIPYFNKVGIRKIDLVFISHLDYDHYGALESLKVNFNIEIIILNNNFSHYNLQDIKFYNLNKYYDYNDDNENNKSSVLLFEFIDLTFLFTGDASKEIEKKIIQDNNIDIDILKVGHHGSNTSTSDEFIQSIKPEVAIISCGRNNRYGHPNKEVLNTLIENNIVVFRTDINGSIKFSKNILNDIIINTKL